MFATNRSHKLATLVITAVGFFMVLLDASIVTVALPSIQSSLHARLIDLQWVVDAYTLPFAVLLLAAGTLGDRFGRKRLFLAGLVGFTFGSAVCGFAPSLGWLIAGRVLQGTGGAALSPGSLALLAAAFEDPRERAQAIGISSGVSGIGIAAGPLIGGLLIQASGWQSIFFVNLPVGLLVFLLGARLLTESRNPQPRRVDVPGQVLAIAALTALTYALIEGQPQGWSSPLIVTLFVAAAVLLLAFVVVEVRQSEPMLPLDLFRNATFSVANVAAFVVGFALLGTVFFISQYFQEVQGYSPLGSGIRSLPNTAGMFIVAPLAGRLTARYGARVPVTFGALLASTALFLFTRLDAATPYSQIWWNLALSGVGFGFMLSPIAAAVLGATPPNRIGLGSSIVNTTRQIGSVFGVALLGAVVVGQFANRLTSGLVALGVPLGVSSQVATTVASSGASAGGRIALLLRTAHVRLAPASIHSAIGHAFALALHPSFVVSGVALLCVAVLTAVAMGHPTSAPAATRPSQPEMVGAAIPPVAADIG
jgi:DHA2 family methylenomycin A resistance protein-like MFS transporter